MSKHDFYKQKFNAHYWSMDSKPTGRFRQLIAKQARAAVRQALRRELNDEETIWRDADILAQMRKEQEEHELQEAFHCYYHGPCPHCMERLNG